MSLSDYPIKRDNLVEACLNRTQERNHTGVRDKTDLFAELKRMKGHTSVGTSSKVDGHSDELSIAEHFDQYTKIFITEQDPINLSGLFLVVLMNSVH